MTSRFTTCEDLDYSDIVARYDVEIDFSTANVVVVDGLPIIDKSKEDKLVARMAKEFMRRGVKTLGQDISVIWDESTGKSKGFAFIEFPDSEIAASAVATMHGFPFDAKHQLKVNYFDDIEKYAGMDTAYLEPELEEFKPKEHLRAWLADPQGRDQYVTNRGAQVTIHWHGKRAQSGIAYRKPDGSPPWTELYVSWSPLGTYLATLHQQGVRLWGGPSYEPLQRFRHPFVLLIDFSPGEKYIVTWSQRPIAVHEGDPQGPEHFTLEDDGNNLAVWDIQSGALLRTFSVSQDNPDDKKEFHWPALKWSPDDRYVARMTSGQQISVYELPTMVLHSKKSIKVDGVADFEWRPSIEGEPGKAAKNKNMLVYWTPEVANQPARVTLLDFPARNVLRQKNLFNVTKCNIYWQSQGDFLCVKVDRHTKTKKTVFCNLEIFRIREKDFPVEVVELKDTVLEFSWEPKGERFAIISSNDPNVGNPASGITLKTEISFFQLDRAKGDFRLLRTLPPVTSNTIRWSPRGRFVVLATVGSPTKSELLFYDLGGGVDDEFGRQKEDWGSGIQQIGAADHYGVTDVDWDPSGRYLSTSASSWKHQLENGYNIWDFRGQEVEKNLQDQFKQFIWRPRPPSLLSKDQQRQVRKNLREYSRQFDQDDAEEDNEVSAELVAYRKRLVDEWNTWRITRKADSGMARASIKEVDVGRLEEVEVWVDELFERIEEISGV
ncbi:eukaryotic translation initiation factor eIF2A-domain-containing protein [Mycena polygramma]|nr:eukaryotic translation initiation factor eIF2A-domain-containing protein [Mycena polygramma]